MPRTELTVEQMNWKTGLTATANAADATNNHSFTNTSGDVFIRVINGSGGAVVVDVLSPKTVGSQGLTVEDPSISVTAGTDKLIGPFPTDIFNQTDGMVYFDVDVDTTITIECVQHGDNS